MTSKLEFGCIAELVVRGGTSLPTILEDNLRTIDVVKDHFSTIWFDDHFHKDHSPTLECWTTLCYFASLYSQLQFGTLVLCQSYRNPGVVGKMMSTIQTLTGGRFIAGVGAGWKEDEYDAYNFHFPPPKVRIAQLEEFVQILVEMWTASPASFSGQHYQLREAECEPIPDPKPPLLIGGSGEKLTLRVVAKYADWMNIAFPDPDMFQHKLDVLQAHCDAVGRPLDEIKKSMWTYVTLTDKPSESQLDDRGRSIITGTDGQVADEIRAFRELGVEHIMIRFTDFPSTGMAERFISSVIPRL